MAYGVTNKEDKILIEISKYDPDKPDKHYTTHISNILTVKQARAFARDIYAYCRIAEKEMEKQ